MTNYRPGGRRRSDRVLDPAFAQGLAAEPDDELRRRRDDAQAEEVDVSYMRRLLQGRLDVLRADRDRRARGERPVVGGGEHSDAEIVAALSRLLADAPPAVRPQVDVDVRPPEHGERRRAPEIAADDIRISDPASLDDAQLAAAIADLERLEREVSDTRRKVLTAVDALDAELKRRLD